MKNSIFLILAAALSGCATYKPIAIKDHPDRPLTTVQVMKRKNYLVWNDVRHQFYLCTEGANSLQCELECDGKTPYECPRGNNFLSVGTSNFR